MNKRTVEEMVSYFNQTVADMDIDRKYKMEMLGMITAILQRHDEDMKHAPTIEERKKGKWERWYEKLEDASGVEYIPFCRCSECKTQYDPHSSKFINFCPNCGADMRGE